MTDDFYGSNATGNTAYSNPNTISTLTGDFYGSIASGNSAYSNHDQIQHQPDDSTVHSSFNNSVITPGYYYDNELPVRHINSSRHSKLNNNTSQFTTPTLPVNIETFEEEGTLNGDNRSSSDNSVANSSYYRDVLNHDENDMYTVDEENETKDINAFSGKAPDVVNSSSFVNRLRSNVESPRLTELVLNQQLDNNGEQRYTKDDINRAIYTDFDDDDFHTERVQILLQLQETKARNEIHASSELNEEINNFINKYNISRGNSIRVNPLIELFSNPQLSKKTLKRPKKPGVPYNTTTRSTNLRDAN